MMNCWCVSGRGQITVKVEGEVIYAQRSQGLLRPSQLFKVLYVTF